MRPSFSALLRKGFEEALSDHLGELEDGAAREPALASVDIAELPRLSRHPSQPLKRQDLVSAAMIRQYRTGPAGPWGAVLLEAMCPRLVTLATIFESKTPSVGSDDIEHQMIIEVLERARVLNISASFRYVQRRLGWRVATEIDRWLRRALRIPSPRRVAWDLDERELCRAEAMFELAELSRDGGLDLALMLRLQVEPEAEVAADLGVSVNALRCRRRRCEARLRGRRDHLRRAA